MDNYTPNPFITQPIYDPTRPFATPTSKTPCHDLAWDVGTGSGQAARSVSFFPPSVTLNCMIKKTS